MLACALLLTACSSAPPTGENADPNCNPLAVGGECLLPWPSSVYLAKDSSTKTGLRVALPAAALPPNQVGKPYDTTRLDMLDGFSPATAIVVNLKARVDESKLPPAADIARSIDPTSTVQILRFDTGERVPLFAEVDHNVMNADEDQVLLVHPAVRLRPATRYVVALRGLVDTGGQPIHVAPFDAAVSGNLPSGSRLAGLGFDGIFALLEQQGVPRSSLTLAWDFTTGSDDLLTGHLVAMRDAALAAWEQMDLGYSVTATPNWMDDHVAAEYLGTYDVPSFLEDDSQGAKLKLDENGKPVLRGVQKFKLVIHVPKCALNSQKPLPIMVFGHGLFGSAQGEMNSGYEKGLIDNLCMLQIGTDWVGLASDDVATVAGKVLGDFSNFDIPTDRLQQAQVNFVILAHLAVRKFKDDPNLHTDGSEIYYYGISQGGIEGGTLMGLTPDILRGALNVGGAEYSLMLTRSADFKTFKGILDNTYPNQRDQEVLLAISQSYWDFADPITFAPYSIKQPLPGPDGKPLPVRHLLMQESINDAQVPNVATRVVVRTLGLPLLNQSITPVFGVSPVDGPVDSAYTQWDSHPMPPPGPYNVPPDEGDGWMGYSAHEAIRRMPQLIEQLRGFLRPDGTITNTCGGPCSFQ